MSRVFKRRDCRECEASFQPKSSRSAWCDDCMRGRRKDWWAKGRRGKTLRKYKMTQVEYDQMLESQGGGCAICGDSENGGVRLFVDHDHACCPAETTCGKCTRGLLCRKCNYAFEIYIKNPSGFAKYYDQAHIDGLPY